MTYYAVIDTNVLVSAMLKWQSVPGSILEFSLEGIVVPVLSEEIVEEYKAVLERPKFGLGDDIISDIISSIEKVGLFVDSEEIDIDLPDPKDRVFYEVVMEQEINGHVDSGVPVFQVQIADLPDLFHARGVEVELKGGDILDAVVGLHKLEPVVEVAGAAAAEFVLVILVDVDSEQIL